MNRARERFTILHGRGPTKSELSDALAITEEDLANLRRLPIDDLKIDRTFVSPMLRDDSDFFIVRSTINLGHDLGLRIIAEGVEDGATLEQLAQLGCDRAQGFHVSRPMPADKFETWLDVANPRYSAALLPPGPASAYEPSPAVAEFSSAVTEPWTPDVDPLPPQVEPVGRRSHARAKIGAVNVASEPA